MSLLVSIIIPAFNVNHFIKKTLESCINQTYVNLEIIVIDDGSTDGTSEKIEEYKKKDSRIKHIKQENRGLAYSRKVGVSLAKGDYIYHLDGDDYIDIDVINEYLQCINKFNIDIVVGKLNRVDENGNILSKLNGDFEGIVSKSDYIIEGYNQLGFNLAGKLIKRSLYFNDVNIHDNIIVGEDFFSIIRLVSFCKSIYVLNDHSYNYVLRSDSIMSKAGIDYDRIFRFIGWLDESLKLVNKRYELKALTAFRKHLIIDVMRCYNQVNIDNKSILFDILNKQFITSEYRKNKSKDLIIYLSATIFKFSPWFGSKTYQLLNYISVKFNALCYRLNR